MQKKKFICKSKVENQKFALVQNAKNQYYAECKTSRKTRMQNACNAELWNFRNVVVQNFI